MGGGRAPWAWRTRGPGGRRFAAAGADGRRARCPGPPDRCPCVGRPRRPGSRALRVVAATVASIHHLMEVAGNRDVRALCDTDRDGTVRSRRTIRRSGHPRSSVGCAACACARCVLAAAIGPAEPRGLRRWHAGAARLRATPRVESESLGSASRMAAGAFAPWGCRTRRARPRPCGPTGSASPPTGCTPTRTARARSGCSRRHVSRDFCKLQEASYVLHFILAAPYRTVCRRDSERSSTVTVEYAGAPGPTVTAAGLVRPGYW